MLGFNGSLVTEKLTLDVGLDPAVRGSDLLTGHTGVSIILGEIELVVTNQMVTSKGGPVGVVVDTVLSSVCFG